MSDTMIEFGKIYLEWRGRGKAAPRYIFQDNEIVSPPYPRNVSSMWKATFLNLHPTHYALGVGPDGRVINLKGGYNLLPPGRYNIYYVDRQNRVYHLPRTGETTFDGFQVGIELDITYRVIDPLRALEVQDAVNSLVRFIQSDLKEFIRSHRYDEIVGDLTGRKIDNEQLVRYIKDQHATRHQMSRLFFVADVVVKEKIGDPKITEQREKFQINHRQLDAQNALLTQNQALEQKLANQDIAIQKIKAQAEVDLLAMTKEMQMQQFEMDKIKSNYRYQLEISRTALEAILRTLGTQTYPPDPEEFKIVKELIGELHAATMQPAATGTGPDQQASVPGEAAPQPNVEKISRLTKMLSGWQRQRPPT